MMDLFEGRVYGFKAGDGRFSGRYKMMERSQ